MAGQRKKIVAFIEYHDLKAIEAKHKGEEYTIPVEIAEEIIPLNCDYSDIRPIILKYLQKRHTKFVKDIQQEQTEISINIEKLLNKTGI